jgi:ATP-dependent helicase/nuclease subunit B
METFIDRIILEINKYQGEETDICVVLPNRRAGLFLKKKLVPSNGKPRWLPAILPVEEFIYQACQLNEPDSISLLGNLYKVYSSLKNDPVSFDTFLNWGTEVLRDFEEIDQYLVNANSLYNYVSEAREIDIWKPGEAQTDFERNYIEFYKAMESLYLGLKESLLGNGIAYQGLATRLLCEEPQKYLDPLPWKMIIFAGFNALTPAQLQIIKYLTQLKKGTLIFDADSYIVDNPHLEAAYFINKFRKDKELPDFRDITSNLLNQNKKIYTCGIPGKTGQARVAGSILKGIPPKKHSVTALVLADEMLLIPVLNALPDEIDRFNVTMGYPLKQTTYFKMADCLFQMHANAIQHSSGNPLFYHADVTALLEIPSMRRLLNIDLVKKLITTIKKDNYAYLSLDNILSIYNGQLQEKDHAIFLTIFGRIEKPIQLPALTCRVLEYIRELNTDDDPTPENEMMYSLYNFTDGLSKNLVKENIEIESVRTMQRLFREMANNVKVSFYGEPLAGIQIMGMLETRVLDFENVILLSANENILPSSKSNKSFIPFDIRLHFGLPTHHERQAVFAYHFYHLLQRCSNAWLIYDKDESKLGGGEMSRYLQQIEWELPKHGLTVRNLTIRENVSKSPKRPITIEKTGPILESLYNRAIKGFSFSSISCYLNCPLSFYYSNIKNLGETEEVEEEISSRSMGTVLHGVLQDLYNKYVGSFPSESALRYTIQNAGSLIERKAKEIFEGIRLDSGKNLLFLKVSEVQLQRYLKSEMQCVIEGKAPVIEGIELPLETLLEIEVAGKPVEVKIYGKIDRIDCIGNTVRVIDYKTGKVEFKASPIKEAEALFDSSKNNSKQLQLSLYKYLVKESDVIKDREIVPGIIAFKNLGLGFIPLNSEVIDQDFKEQLIKLFEEIFDPSISFQQNDLKHCRYCNFKQICHRESI